MPNHTGYTSVIITVFIQNRSINRYIMKKHKRKFPARLFTAMKRELREHRSSFIAYNIFRALVIVIMIFTIFNRNFESSFLCLLTLILLTVPSLMQVALKIEAVMEIVIFVVLVYAAKRAERKISVLWAYILMYAPVRFCLEFLRGDEARGGLLMLSVSQWISIILVAAVLVHIYISGRQNRKQDFRRQVNDQKSS